MARPRTKPDGEFGNITGGNGGENAGTIGENHSDSASNASTAGTANGSIIEPSNIGLGDGSGNVGTDSGNPPRRRGRKPGSRNKPKDGGAQNTTLDLATTAAIIHATHKLVAGVIAPEFALTEDESLKLASAVNGVARHYDIAASQKALDWTNLVMTGVGIYGVRFMMASQRLRSERAAKKAAEGGNNLGLNYGLQPGVQ